MYLTVKSLLNQINKISHSKICLLLFLQQGDHDIEWNPQYFLQALYYSVFEWKCPKTSRSGLSSSLRGIFVCRGVLLDTWLSGNGCTKQPIMTPLHETYIWWSSSHFAQSCSRLERGAGQDWKSHSKIISSRIYFQPGHCAHFLKLLLEFHRILKTVSIYQHFEQIMLVIQVKRPRARVLC